MVFNMFNGNYLQAAGFPCLHVPMPKFGLKHSAGMVLCIAFG